MKKFLCILILTLGWLVSKGQLYPPIQPYQENDYSLSQVKRFAMAQTELSSSWRKEFLAIVNYGLAQAGENMYLGEDKILSALDHVVYERRKLTSFENSRNISNEVKFFPDFDFDGMAGVFKYGKCSLVVFKTKCINLIKYSIDVVQIQIEIKPEIVPDRFVPAERDQNQYAWTKITKQEEFVNPNLFITKTIRTRTWVGKHVVPIVIAFVATSATIYVVANHDRHHDVIPPTVEPRTMPPGIPAVPVVPTPGVPSDPRTMPPGTGYVPHTNFGGGGITLFRF